MYNITWAFCLIKAKTSQVEINYYTTAVIKLVGQNHSRVHMLGCTSLCKLAISFYIVIIKILMNDAMFFFQHSVVLILS